MESTALKLQLIEQLVKMKPPPLMLTESSKRLEKQLEDRRLELECLGEKIQQEIEFVSGVDILKSAENEIHVEEDLATVKIPREKETLKRTKRKTEFPAFETNLERKKKLLEPSTGKGKLTPGQQISTHVETQNVMVIGGRDQNGEILRSVEAYLIFEGRWIELPTMNTPRSFMSSVVVDQCVIVSGGQTDVDAITDSIEILNLAEAPLQWKVSPATLPVPLSAHQTVVHRGSLIVIGGHDGNEGRNSDKIYEIPLTPPHTPQILSSLPQPKAWHGAELVYDKIFILGGGRNSFVPTRDVWVYSLLEGQWSEMTDLPFPVQGMATIQRWNTVLLLGGVDSQDEKLHEVISYDVQSGTILRCCNIQLSSALWLHAKFYTSELLSVCPQVKETGYHR